MPSILEAAKAYIRAGLAPVPIDMQVDDETGKPRKHPTRKWKPWQEGPMSEAEAGRIWGRGNNGLAIIAGAYNPLHLCALDIEAGDAAEKARQMFAGKTIMVDSGRGGVHVWVRSVQRCIGGALAPGIADLQATGQLIIVPPTPGYEHAAHFQRDAGFIEANTIEVEDVGSWAIEVLRKLGVQPEHLHKASWESLQGPEITAEARNQVLASVAGKLRQRLHLHPSNIEAMLRGLFEHRMPQENFDPDEEIPKMANQTAGWEIKYQTGEYTYLGVGQTEPEPPTWLWENIIYEHFLTLFYGLGGVGKTEMLQWLCYHMLLGKSCLGIETKQINNIIWWDYEVDLREFTRRAFRYARAMGLKEPPPGIHYFRGRQPASSPKAQEELMDMIDATGAEFVVLDSVFRALGGDPLEQRDLITNLFVFLDGLPIPSGIIDHSAKPQFGQNIKGMSAYGFGGKMWTARNAWQMGRTDVGSGATTMAGFLRREKNNCGLPNNYEIPFQMRGLTTDAVEIVATGDPALGKGMREQVIAKVLEQARPMTALELQTEHLTGHPQATIRDALQDAANDKMLGVFRGSGRRPSFYAPPKWDWSDLQAAVDND